MLFHNYIEKDYCILCSEDLFCFDITFFYISKSFLKMENSNPQTDPLAKYFMNTLNQTTAERVGRNRLARQRSNMVGLVLGTSALAIYFYTIYAIKQETFLDNFEPPNKS
ncbi:Cytochrome c oxidase assembly factor 3 [Trichinella spiralis]|uniref:Cytochrome c oxidase assembly factor 3 n=1 Tax=Trichinella spiralis TaxID=6334 RepID=A0ABR3L1W8_TRISP